MPKDDRIRLRHMLDFVREAVSFARGRSRSDLDHDRMLALALVKCIEIVGEAAASVSPQARARYATIPWADIIGMRNRLVHAYFDIDQVWDTTTDDLPPLVTERERIVPPAEEG